ncbi:MAG: LPS export ABC transporter periplasmic protein LptC [Proteobacteria bacterium]|nr:MAG: LPS export ABC transporter periplasmic protein LptC [Pseudomonadota bacterium]
MMRNLSRIMFVIALVAAGVVTWLNLSWKTLEQFTNSPSESRIDYYLSDFTLTQTNPNGVVRYQLTGRHLTHKQASGASEIFQPHIQVRSQSGDIIIVDAEKASQTADGGIMTLAGEIRVHKNKSPNSPEFTLTTEDLIYNPEKRQLSTESKVSLISPAGTLTGTGIQTNLDEQELRILSNVQAEFQTP